MYENIQIGDIDMKKLPKYSVIILIISLLAILCSCAAIPQPQQNGTEYFTSNQYFPSGFVDNALDSSCVATTANATEAQTAATVPAHIHNFGPATCVSPMMCECGATQGSTAPHRWIDANCFNPKTCEVCGATTGSPTAHKYSSGYCKFCGESDPNYSDADGDMVWIPTKGGKKYHSHSGCSNMIDPDYVSKSDAVDRGFTPCKKCY